MWNGTRAVNLFALASFVIAPAAIARAAESPGPATTAPLASPAIAPSPGGLAAVPTATTASPAPLSPLPLAIPSSTGQGLAVVAFPGATDAAWPLAQAVYADQGLRAAALGEANARILCGDAPPADATPALRDLAQTVAALRGDDAPTRVLLTEIARRFAVRALVSVWADGSGHPTAHVFLPESGAFDAAVYPPDNGTPVSWSGAVQSLDRIFAAPMPVPTPRLATHEVPQERAGTHGHFYESPWFWGGLGAAAAAAAAIYLSTRDSSSPTIHLELQVPK